LRDLRDHAVARSPFYARLHAGLERRSLHELPIVTKAMLMESFDELSTDRTVRRADVEAYLKTVGDTDSLFAGRYRVATTSGSTGLRGVFLSDEDEWSWVLASYARANDWAGIAAGLTHRARIAVVSSRTPWHQSALVARSLESRLVRTLRLDSTEPISTLVAALDEFQPESLVGYASMMRLLAEEQLAGRLHIAPIAVMSASEVLTEETQKRIEEAWGRAPFDVYAATEPAGVASHCAHHRMHLYEDLVITEIVDERNEPVPPGNFGAKVLVTVLFSRTQPLIRYEMSDSLALSAQVCPCGLPFGVITGIQGRREETLRLPGIEGGEVDVRPLVVHRVLDAVDVRAWQVVSSRSRGIRVLLAGARTSVDDREVAAALRGALERAGARAPSIAVERVEAIPRTAMGKAPLIRVES
jgi:putative adenylate-forming enzyme